MLRRILCVRCFGRRKKPVYVLLIIVWSLIALATCRWFAAVNSGALQPPAPPDQDLEHFRRNRSLSHYLDNIQLLIEPSSHACATLQPTPVLVLVTSSPSRFEHRQAIRRTWGSHQPTYFVLGLERVKVDDQLVDIYIEAKEYSDMIVYEFRDHYQNLTLKTALMMQWTLARCVHAQFMFKVDDDVFVNPWKLAEVVADREDSKLLGYKIENIIVHRDERNKWYMPRWLYPEDSVPEYLAGPGYLINTDYLQNIFNQAHRVPLINLEDVFFTYVVAKKSLDLQLSHEKRLSPYKPWFHAVCGYWTRAAAHSLSPEEMLSVWEEVEEISRSNSDDVCSFYDNYLTSDMFLY